MSPLGKDGAFNMNPQQSRGRDAAMAAPAIAPPAADDGSGDTTITLTMKPDGTVTCDNGDGTGPMPYKSMGEALDSLQQQYGTDSDDSSSESGQGEAPSGGGSEQDQY